jgi:Family of unknown function (DUF6464)
LKEPHIGDPMCRHNALSQHLRCAVNPKGPCQGCRDFEQVFKLRDKIPRAIRKRWKVLNFSYNRLSIAVAFVVLLLDKEPYSAITVYRCIAISTGISKIFYFWVGLTCFVAEYRSSIKAKIWFFEPLLWAIAIGSILQ